MSSALLASPESEATFLATSCTASGQKRPGGRPSRRARTIWDSWECVYGGNWHRVRPSLR